MMFFHFQANTTNQFLYHFLFAGHHLAEIESNFTGFDAIFTAIFGIVIQFCTVKQRLGWYATFVKTNPTQLALLEQNYIETFVTGPFGSYISRWSATYYC